MNGRREVSDDVRAVLTAGQLRHALETTRRRRCLLCDGPLEPGTDDAAIIVEFYLDGATIVFAHSRCLPSQVTYTGREMPAPDDDVETVAAILPHIDGPRAVLVINPEGPMSDLSPAGEDLDRWSSGLLSAGWSLLTTVGRQPKLVDGWQVTVDAKLGTGAIIAADGSIFLDHLPDDLPPQWIPLALQTGQVTLFGGAFDLDSMLEDPRPWTYLNRIARRGSLVGARVTTEPVVSEEHPLQQAGRSVARLLTKVIDEVPTREGIRAQAAVRLRADPKVTPVLAGNGAPLLYFDLNEQSQDRVESVLDGVKGLGLKGGTAANLSEYFMPNTPEDWACLVWMSQIKILASFRAPYRMLWFTSFVHADLNWYQVVRERRALGLLIGNNLDLQMEELDILNGLRDGSMIGAGIKAMAMR